MEQRITFERYQLDLASEQLWCGSQEIPLPAKAFALLRYLVEHAGQLVSKADLFAALWPGTVVTDGALTFCVGEVRKALGDTPRAPQYIETVPRRGFRFLPTVTTTPPGVSSQSPGVRREETKPPAQREDFSPAPSPQHLAPLLVGRGTELAFLHALLDNARRGERQLVFVTGEPGIGKTALLDTFRQRLETRGWRLDSSPQASSLKPLASSVSFAHGQCIEQHGAGEAFLPVLDALGRLARGTGGARLIEILRTYAPMWLVQLPAFIDGDELETLQRKVQGASRERMLREMADALERVAAEQPLILVLEDLHWSDVSTLDLLAFLARRKEPARLLVIGTYRPVEMLNDGHPLQGITQEMYAHQLAMELSLGVLSESDIGAYLNQRLNGGARRAGSQQTLARLLHQRTGGNPLFLVATVDELAAQGRLTQSDNAWVLQGEVEDVGIAESIRHLVARQRGRLSTDERQMLEAASVAGMEFSAAAVSAALTTDTTTIEQRCEQLAEKKKFLKRLGVEAWPDGTLAARYSFLHALYQKLWHERVTPTQLQHQHLRIGERKEQAYGDRAREIAPELALHFEQARDYRKAVQYLQLAGENAVRCNAYQEAIMHITKGVQLLKLLPDTPERAQQDLQLQINLGRTLSLTKGYGAPEAAYAYAQARALSLHVKEMPQLFQALIGFWSFYLARAELQTARELAEQMLSLVQAGPSVLLFGPRLTLGSTLFWLGELSAAHEQLEQNLARCNSQQLRILAASSGENAEAFCLSYVALALWLLGYPDQALRKSEQALLLAQELPFSSGWAGALFRDTWLHQFRRESQVTYERTEAVLTLATAQGFAEWLVHGSILQGWALAELDQQEKGMTQILNGAENRHAIGSELGRTRDLALLAEVYGKARRVEEGLDALAEAFIQAEKSGERFYEAELYRLKGTLTLQSQASLKQVKGSQNTSAFINPRPPIPNPQAVAEACFLKAIEVARKQQAKSLELRATVNLARLWQRHGKHPEAHSMLSEVYNWFTEGFDTKDLQEAKVLLEALSR